MLERLILKVPDAWREMAEFLMAPIIWIPRLQRHLLDFFMFDSNSAWTTIAKYVFLLFPLLLAVAGLWCTQLSLYTLPFRAKRISYISTLLVMWWDAARAVWMYWVGLFRMVVVIAGWIFHLGGLAFRFLLDALKQIVVAPFSMAGGMTSKYFQPGVPWVAFLMLVFWCMLETTIFTYTLYPTISEVLADMVGAEGGARYMTPILWVFLFMLIMGSFACVQALADALAKHEFKFVVQIVLVEVFVMIFEVMFLYRELVDTITPWIAQQTGERFRMGILFTLSLATFGWVGIRGMTWFLFGRYGTPSLLAFISREPIEMAEGRVAPTAGAKAPGWWRGPMEDFKKEIGWLHERSDQLVEYLALPALHILASMLNFGMVLLTAKPIFSLPFKGLKEVMETRELLAGVHHLTPRKGESA